MRKLTDTITRLDANVRHITRHATTADRQIRTSLSVADGYPTATSLGRTSGGGSELTSVEAAADKRLALGDARTEHLRQLLEQAEQLTYNIVNLVNSWLPTPERSTNDRCSGGGSLPGALDWGRPDCTNIGTSRRAGLCDACYMRWKRWERDDGPSAA
jgi:hypothetical protein